MQAKLIVVKGRHQGKVLPVTRAEFIIGRHRDCQLRVTSTQVSVHHCAVLLREKSAWVRDFGSTNGTFVNDALVNADQELHHDDTLRIGPLVLRVQLEQGPPAKLTRKKPAEALEESAIAQPMPPRSRDVAAAKTTNR